MNRWAISTGLRGVSQEDQFPLIKQLFDMARENHRRWVEVNFADALAPARGAERERRTLLLFAATDFYIWKLYRWDLGRSREWTTGRMSDLVTALSSRFPEAAMKRFLFVVIDGGGNVPAVARHRPASRRPRARRACARRSIHAA